MTLYDIGDHLACLLDTLEGMTEDTPAELRTELETAMHTAVAAELKKVDGVCRMLAHFEHQAAFAAAEIKRLQARKGTFERAVERLEGSVQAAMDALGKKKIEGETYTLRLAKNPASVIIENEADIPVCYKDHTPEFWTVRKADVKKALKAGIAVPGADLSEDNERVEWK